MTLEARHAILDALLASLDEEHATAILDHRKTKKCPLTPFAAKLMAKEFAKCPDPNAAAEEMILRGWQGFKAEWMITRATQKKSSRRTFSDVAVDRFTNGTAGISRTDTTLGQLSTNQREPGPDSERLRIGSEWPIAPSHH